jgi:hypothetical protein
VRRPVYHPGHPHPGVDDPDRINIEIALAGLRLYIMPIDRAFLLEIEALIRATQYPYKIGGEKLDLLGKIIRHLLFRYRSCTPRLLSNFTLNEREKFIFSMII